MTTTSNLFIGIDVSKADLAIARSDMAAAVTIDNEKKAIRAWLKTLPGPAAIAVEATNTYHRLLLTEAECLGHRLYVTDGYRLNRYRDSIGSRAKTDRTDAELLLRYLQREVDQLRPWSAPPAAYTAIQQLLHRRATLVQAKTTLQQSLGDIPGLKRSLQALLRRIDHLDRQIQQRLQQALREAGWHHDRQRCQAIEGVGPLTAAALTSVFHRGHFQSSDAFIAFIGLDVRVRDSGTQRGLQPTQALVILARKLARIAFALMKQQRDYQPRNTCVAT